MIHFRTVADYERLRAAARPGERVVVVGGGFVGSELAASLATAGAQTTMVFPEPAIGARAYGPELSSFIDDRFREHGVELLAGDAVSSIAEHGGRFRVETRSGRRLEAAAVVAGIGIQPNVGLAQAAGLAVEDGILVDERLRASAPGVFAAGDVARLELPALGRVRVEHEDAAVTMGRAAGRSMAGDPTPYRHVPFFYSDLFDMGYEAVGRLDARLERFADWRDPFREGVVYYLEGGRVRGVLLWNVWGQVEAARELLLAPGPFGSADLRGRIA